MDVLRGVAGRKLSLTPINAVNGLLILNQVINDNIAIVVFIRTPLRYGMPDRNLFKSGGVDKIVRMLDRYIGVVITGETGRRKDFLRRPVHVNDAIWRPVR